MFLFNGDIIFIYLKTKISRCTRVRTQLHFAKCGSKCICIVANILASWVEPAEQRCHADAFSSLFQSNSLSKQQMIIANPAVLHLPRYI